MLALSARVVYIDKVWRDVAHPARLSLALPHQRGVTVARRRCSPPPRARARALQPAKLVKIASVFFNLGTFAMAPAAPAPGAAERRPSAAAAAAAARERAVVPTAARSGGGAVGGGDGALDGARGGDDGASGGDA
jgi:hypothetical protein